MLQQDAEVPALLFSVAAVVHFSFCWVTLDQVHQGQVGHYRFLDWVFFWLLKVEYFLLSILDYFLEGLYF